MCWRIITCAHCKEEFEVTHVRAQNVKFCSKKCRGKADYQRNKESHTASNHAHYNKPWVGKIQCVICGGWYHKVCSHVYYRHWMNEQEYKDFLWLDRGKGLVSEAHHDLLKDNALANGMDKQMSEAWKATRWTKESPSSNYQRSAETLERLKGLHKFNKKLQK